jgi:hypothetical protein
MAKDNNTDAAEAVDPRKDALNAGMWIFLMLGVLTIGEFIVAVIAPPWLWALWLAATWKAIYVVKDYMHIGRVFSGEEETH